METETTALTPLEIASIAETPQRLIALAISNGTPPESLAKLLDLSERWEAMRARNEFVVAMSEFKKACPPAIIKQSTVDFTTQKGRTNYNYANLGDCVNQTTPILAKHGLHVSWQTKTPKGNKPIKVTCHVTHAAGHRESVTLAGPADQSGNKNAMQAIGSAVTYLQRYTLLAALGLATMEDDDGQGGDVTPKQNGNAEKTQDLAAKPKARDPQGNHGTVTADSKPGEPPKQPATEPSAKDDRPAWMQKLGDTTAVVKFCLEAVAATSKIADPVKGLDKLNKISGNISVKDIGQEGYAEIMRAITEAEKAFAPQDEVDPFANDAIDDPTKQLPALDVLLKDTQSATEVSVMRTHWFEDKASFSEAVFKKGLAMFDAAEKRFQ